MPPLKRAVPVRGAQARGGYFFSPDSGKRRTCWKGGARQAGDSGQWTVVGGVDSETVNGEKWTVDGGTVDSQRPTSNLEP
jgi:hypothetical protein